MRPMLMFALLAACGPKAPVETPAEGTAEEAPAVEEASEHPGSTGVSDPALAALLEEHWDTTMAWYPTWATGLGDHRFDDTLEDGSFEAEQARRATRDGWLATARAMDASSLSEQDALTLALFIGSLESGKNREVCRFDEWNFSPRSNPLVDYNYLPEIQPLESPEDIEALLARWRAIPANIDHSVEALRRGAADGWFANAESTGRVIEQIRAEMDKPVEEWVLMSPASTAIEGLDEASAEAFAADVRAAVEEGVKPALVRYADFLESDILPNARPAEKSGLLHLPGGEACYGALVAHYTTLDVGAEDRHKTGLSELKKIHDEFRTIGKRVFDTDDLATIFERLRTDESLYFETSEEVQAKADEALDRAEAAMGDYFGILPQAECVVRPVPDYEAPYTTIAYYRGPNPDGSKPGEYFVNTYAPETRPRHEAEVLAFHEAIPGHHLQIAISQELPDLPMFRKHMGQTAFVEGWALYTERLSEEMGLYSGCLLYTSPSPRDGLLSRMPSSA